MMVTFISQCEKNALKKTRRVLDAFADRIGDNTWQTIITQDGLNAVKKLLRKTATKSTAVSCHWLRSRSRSELVWVVGQKDKFNSRGIVPVNITESATSQYADQHQWSTIDIISYAAQIAGLFHDFGKANTLFQDKINPDKKTPNAEPYRHEWISLRLFQAFVADKTDRQWLEELSEIDVDCIDQCFRDGVDKGFGKHPLLNLPSFAQIVAWIIVSHHRLPLAPAWQNNFTAPALDNIKDWLDPAFYARWNSYHCEDNDQKSRIQDNWTFAERALPYHSFKWRCRASDIASNTLKHFSQWHNEQADYLHDHLFTSHLARLCMMLADRYYSQQDITTEWQSQNYRVYANTYGKEDHRRGFKQKLDEHLIGVAHHSRKITKALINLNHSLPKLSDISTLTQKVKKEDEGKYGWQDDAVKLAKKLGKETIINGFFGVNMASTGQGKTIGNAKIMYALGQETGRTRFSVALGLRTLTLQTGQSFKTDLELNDEDLAIAVGGTAIKQLFDYSHQKSAEEENGTGSESADEALDKEAYVHYTGDTSHSLSEWTEKDKRVDKILHAPVLVCTIDHLISATEGTRGGRQTAAMLRLLTSDLILDEPDDFSQEDLPALCRLVHWAGMLGSRVLLSTATLPPALAYALFESYRNGWKQYAMANIPVWKGEICCGWFDEFLKTDSGQHLISSLKDYKAQHNRFIKPRVKRLTELSDPGKNHKQWGSIALIEPGSSASPADALAATVYQQMAQLHREHCVTKDNRSLSIGLVRMANIDPLVRVAKTLLAMDAPATHTAGDTCVHLCVYHSRYPLAIRNFIEQCLDATLKRKNPEAIWASGSSVSRVMEQHSQPHHIFVVLASPVAEVGRDHDYDWAIVEPSSMRSIIQLAGRVLRHREIYPKAPNVILLDQNYKALGNKDVCFERPGFETRKMQLASTHISRLLHAHQYQSINAIPRITLPDSKDNNPDKEDKYTNLNGLEHKALAWQLFSGEKRAKFWWDSEQRIKPWWCGEVQRQQKFRQSEKDEAYYLWLHDFHSTAYWRWYNEAAKPPKFGDDPGIETATPLTLGQGMHFWLDQSPETIYQTLASDLGMDLSQVSWNFGELRAPEMQENMHEYDYHHQLGLYRRG